MYVTGAFVKVGFFREGMDLVYQDALLASLQRKGVIKRVGPDKGGHWEVLD
jgi:hypothetical protein